MKKSEIINETVPHNDLIEAQKPKRKKVIRSKKGNLLNYFICNHKDLSKNYLNDCKKFFKTLNTNNNKEVKNGCTRSNKTN